MDRALAPNIGANAVSQRQKTASSSIGGLHWPWSLRIDELGASAIAFQEITKTDRDSIAAKRRLGAWDCAVLEVSSLAR